MIWELPYSVEIDGKDYEIRKKCDYRVVLECLSALNDDDLPETDRVIACLYIFYEDISGCTNIQKAVQEMFTIINGGEVDSAPRNASKPVLMDWERDFNLIAPPVSRVLGYDVRTPYAVKSTHWITFLGAFHEIGECAFQNIVSIRSKRAKGKKLESWEQEYYLENKSKIDLPSRLSSDDREWLESD